MPNSELSSAGNDNLEEGDVESSDSQVPCPLLLKGLELVFDLFSCLWTAVSRNHESDKENSNDNSKYGSKKNKDLQIVEDRCLLCFVDNHNLFTSDPVDQVEVWIPGLDELLWVQGVELDELDELVSIEMDIGWYNNSVEFKVANNLESEEHAPQVIHSSLESKLGNNLKNDQGNHSIVGLLGIGLKFFLTNILWNLSWTELNRSSFVLWKGFS